MGFAGTLLACLLACASACSQPSSSSTSGQAPQPPNTTATTAPAGSITAAHAASATTAESSAKPPPPPAPPLVTLADGEAIDIIDLHVDTPWKVHFKGRPATLPEGHATPDMLRDAHYAAIVYPIYIPDYIHQWKPTVKDADDIFTTVDKIIAANALLHPATNGPCPPERVCAFAAIEGAGGFAENITEIDRFIRLGVRLVGPVHAHDNKLASSATGQRDRGLTQLGKDFCARVYAAGGLVDVSHMSDRSFADLIPIAKRAGAPIVATHSNARAVANHKRNLTDEQLRAIAESGGVAGLNLHSPFVHRGKKVSLQHVIAQVKHMVKVAGVDHVALGSDYDGGKPVPALNHAGKLPKLVEALRADGMSEQDVRKIFAGNALRMLLWRPAEQDGPAPASP